MWQSMSNLGFYYIAGYYTIEETLDKSLETAKTIQTKFSYWQGMRLGQEPMLLTADISMNS